MNVSEATASLRYSDQQLDALRLEADALVDPPVADLVAGGKLREFDAALATWTRNDQLPQDAFAAPLREALVLAGRPALRIDHDRLARGAQLFQRNAVAMSVLLGTVSLLECYGSRRGVQVLAATGKLGHGAATQRIGATGQFVLAVTRPNAFAPEGGALPLLARVRVMHAVARAMLLRRGWDVAGLGVPINQEDLLGTLLAFGCSPIMQLPKLGVAPTAAEREDYLALWRVAGALVGVREDLVPRTWADAEALGAAMVRRHREPSPEGIALTAAMLDTYFRDLPSARLRDGFVALLRSLAGDELCDMLEVPRARWRVGSAGQVALFRALRAAGERVPGARRAASRISLALLERQAVRLGGGVARFRAPTLVPHPRASAAAKTILITGATSGIGRCAALDLARRGHFVIATGRDEKALAALRDEARDAPLEALRLDVTDEATICAARDRVAAWTSGRGLDALVNNAGYGHAGPIEEIDDAALRAQFETNVFGLMAVTRAFLPAMRVRGAGRVVNVSSISGRVALPFFGAYTASKYAVEALSDTLRREVASFGVDVVLIEPGPTRSDFSRRSMDLVARAARPGSPYAGAYARADALRRISDGQAASPAVVASAIREAVCARRPRARYVVPATSRALLAALDVTPTIAADWMLRVAIGFTGAGGGER